MPWNTGQLGSPQEFTHRLAREKETQELTPREAGWIATAIAPFLLRLRTHPIPVIAQTCVVFKNRSFWFSLKMNFLILARWVEEGVQKWPLNQLWRTWKCTPWHTLMTLNKHGFGCALVLPLCGTESSLLVCYKYGVFQTNSTQALVSSPSYHSLKTKERK